MQWKERDGEKCFKGSLNIHYLYSTNDVHWFFTELDKLPPPKDTFLSEKTFCLNYVSGRNITKAGEGEGEAIKSREKGVEY